VSGHASPGISVPLPNQVPSVALTIQEYGDLTIRLNTGGRDKSDASRDHPRVHHLEVIDAKEEAHSARELLSNNGGLVFAVRASQQQAGTTTNRAHYNPAFRATVIGQRGNVFHELELQDVHKEVDGRLILSHHQSNQLNV
jgi:hypothetical protein